MSKVAAALGRALVSVESNLSPEERAEQMNSDAPLLWLLNFATGPETDSALTADEHAACWEAYDGAKEVLNRWTSSSST